MSSSVDVLREAIEEAYAYKSAESTRATRLAALNWLVVDRDDWKTLFLRENRSRLDAEIALEAAESRVAELEAGVARLREALTPFVRNASVITDDAAVRTYGDGFVFNRVALGDDGKELVWGVKIADVEQAVRALAAEETTTWNR